MTNMMSRKECESRNPDVLGKERILEVELPKSLYPPLIKGDSA
jgi:hypothetical protein